MDIKFRPKILVPGSILYDDNRYTMRVTNMPGRVVSISAISKM